MIWGFYYLDHLLTKISMKSLEINEFSVRILVPRILFIWPEVEKVWEQTERNFRFEPISRSLTSLRRLSDNFQILFVYPTCTYDLYMIKYILSNMNAERNLAEKKIPRKCFNFSTYIQDSGSLYFIHELRIVYVN